MHYLLNLCNVMHYLLNFNLPCFYQILSIPKYVWADVFHYICLHESNIHLIKTCSVILEYHSGFRLMIHLTLFGQNTLHGAQPNCLLGRCLKS